MSTSVSLAYHKSNNCDCLVGRINNNFSNSLSRDVTAAVAQAPEETIEKTIVEKMLIQGMNKLSFDEYQREQEDLHGVVADFPERTDEMNYLIQLLQNTLNDIKHGTAYHTAESLNRSYVSDRDFRMTFLRANRYCPKAAADQMIRHFNLKLRLFGKDKLARDIALSDLDDDDVKTLIGGSYQVSPVRDRAGRAILLKVPSLRAFKTVENELRGRFYFYTEMIKSLDSPNHGVVMVNYNVGQFRDTKGAVGLAENVQLTFAMPLHFSGIHLLFDRQQDVLLSKSVMSLALVSPQLAARVKLFCGSHLECQYHMSSFGMPAKVLPLPLIETESILGYQLAWYQDCLERENNTLNDNDNNEKPAANENDVLYVGKKVNNQGNERLLHMASIHQDWYNTGNMKERRILVDLMMESIKRNGGRFLKPNGLDFKELPAVEIREKIAQMFRNMKKRSRAHAQKFASSKHEEVVRIVNTIEKDDVLFGRKSDQPGNRKLRSLIESMSAEYNSSSRGKKKEMADLVVSSIKDNGGRFLKPADNGKWSEVTDKVAEMKVSSHFRNSRRVSKKQGLHHVAVL